MTKEFKPRGYNSVSPYFVVDKASEFVDFLKTVFNGKELRRYDMPDGTIMHAEVQIDDSVIMLGNSSAQWPQNSLLIHLYHPNVDEVFARALANGCTSIEEPKERDGDPDRRGSFKDRWGNIWSIGTQK